MDSPDNRQMRGAVMLKYHGPQLIRTGFIGAVLIVLTIGVGLTPQRIVAWATTVKYQAVFDDTGGLARGDDVFLSGVKIGTVAEISLREDDGVALVTFVANSSVALGNDTTAHIRTGTLLGKRILTLEPSGGGRLRRGDTIPSSRTSSPYSLTEAVSDLTTNTAGTDTTALNQSLDTLSATLDQIGPHLGPTFDGLTQVSRALNSRNDTLRDLLEKASEVSGILAERSQQLNTLLLDANDLTAVLNERRETIVSLLAHTSVLAQQLSGLIADNEQQLAPALTRLNSVIAMLERNRDSIARALPGLAKYARMAGEAVSTGTFANAYVANLTPGSLLQPFLDYAFGFRRGVDAGQPPDNAGPRAEFPFPVNGIPMPGGHP